MVALLVQNKEEVYFKIMNRRFGSLFEQMHSLTNQQQNMGPQKSLLSQDIYNAKSMDCILPLGSKNHSCYVITQQESQNKLIINMISKAQ